jgi:hypothetical protein
VNANKSYQESAIRLCNLVTFCAKIRAKIARRATLLWLVLYEQGMKKFWLGVLIGGFFAFLGTFVYFAKYLHERETALHVSFLSVQLNDLTIKSGISEERRYCLELRLAKSYIKDIEDGIAELDAGYRYSSYNKWMLDSATELISTYKTKFVENSNYECKNT